MLQGASQQELVLPSIPDVVRECLSQMYGSDPDIEKLSKLAQKDLGVTASVLKVAHSALYVSAKPTSDLKLAITRIGLSSFMQILIQHSLESLFRFEPIHFFNIRSFIHHCSWVSQIAFELGKNCSMSNANDLLVAGLLHDVGLIVRIFLDKKSAQQLIEKCIRSQCDFITAEKEMGFESHDFLAERLLEKWRIPEAVILLVKYHHAPPIERPVNLTPLQNKGVSILDLADRLAHRFGRGFEGYFRDTRISTTEFEILGFTHREVVAALRSASHQLQYF